MKVGKKLLSVLLAVIMIMSSMSVCFGTFSFTASAADDSKIKTFAEALSAASGTLENLYNKSTGFTVSASSSGKANNTNALTKTTTVTLSNYSDYATLKNLVALFHEAIMATEEIEKTGASDAATRTCTSGSHIYIEFEKKLPKNGCTMTDPVIYFLKLVLDDANARQHDNYEEKKKGILSNPSSSSTPASLTNTLTIKATDEAYKGYLASIGAYTNCDATIDLGVKYVFTMGRGYYTSKSGLTTYWRFHNYVASKPSAPVYYQNSNSEAKGKLDAHATVIDNFTNVSFDDLLKKVDNNTIDTFLSDFTSAESTMQTYVGGPSTYNSLYSSKTTAVATQKASIASAKSMAEYRPIVQNYKDFVAANPSYGVFTWGEGGGANNWGAFGEKGSATHAKMEADYTTFMGYYNALVAGGTVLDYFVNNGDIDMNYLHNFTDNYKVYYLNDSRNAADNFYNTYKDTYKDYETAEQEALYSEISGYINAIGTYRSNVRGGELEVINAIYNEGYVYLLDLQEDLKCEINEFVLYFAENAHKSFIDLATGDIYNKINEVKEKKNGLDNFYNTITYSRRDQLLGQIRTDADNMLDGLYRLLADRFTAQVVAVDKAYTEIGRPSTLDMVKYLKLKGVVVPLEDGWDKLYYSENYDDDAGNNKGKKDGIQDYLNNEGKGSYISSETMTTYNSYFNGIYFEYCRYATTYGFADYVQSYMTYEDRDVYADDEVKTEAYEVTEQKLLDTISALDTIITSDTVTGILGSLLNEDGSPLNIGEMLSDLVKGFLFKDEFINLVVQLLYPLVLGEFTKVFNDLPPEAAGMSVTYNKDFHTVCKETGLELFPDLLAGVIDANKYPEAVAMLKKAGGYDDSWTSVEILDTETGKLKLKWGIDEIEDLDEREEKFYEAFAAAAEGLKPLLMALIANQSWEPSSVTGFAHAAVLNVTLSLGATGNSGYANTLVPIYELLGVPFTAVSTVEKSTDVAYILEQILAPIFTFIEELAEKPVDTLLGVLPNLIYALAFGMVKPLLNKLYTQVWYKAGVVSGGAITVTSGGVDIYIGDTIINTKDDALLNESMFAGGLTTLLANFGINLPAIDQSKLATLGELKKVSTARKEAFYSGVSSGEAYTIVADKADVAYYLLSYILGLVKDEAAFTNLLGAFMTLKDENGEAIKDANDKTIPDEEAINNLKTTLYNDEGLNLDAINVGDAIAAIVELANQVEYGVTPYYWYGGENNSPVGTAADEIYLNPNNDWTDAKAQYLYDNLDTLVASILTMANVDLDAEAEGVQNNLGELLGGLIGGLLGDKTLTSLAGLLGKLDLNTLLAPKAEEGEDAPEANEPEAQAEGEEAEEAGLDLATILTDLLKNELGIDLSVFTAADSVYATVAAAVEADPEYVHDFGVDSGDKTFAEVLATLLAPAKPLLDFILGGKDLTLIDSAITLHGYKGYDNALIPLLEALGATPAAYTDGADTLKLTVDALVARIEALTTGDVIKNIIDLLPGVVYYLSSNALSQGIDKLLTPVYAILDTIRPIYNLDLAEMIKGIEIGEEGNKKPLGLDIKNLNLHAILTLVKDLVGLDLTGLAQVAYDVCDDLGTTYTSKSTLNSTWKKGAYNANFNQADMLTVILSFVLEWATDEDNAAKLDEMLGTDGIIAALNDVFASVEIEYDREPNWMYWFETEEEFLAHVNGDANLPITLDSIDWDNIGDNDWDLETAQYFAENIDVLVDTVIAMINKDEDAPKTLSALLNKLIADNINAQTLTDLVGMIAGLLGDIDDNLLETAGYILGDSSTDKKEIDIVGLKGYTCTAEIDSISDFINELAVVLDTYASGLIDWLFFGNDFRFAKKSTGEDTIVINGGLGYEKGLAMILEALGCELPTKANTKSVLGALATRVEAILANPVDEVLDLLPNLVYFLNANGAGVAVDNLLKPVYALLDKLSAFGLNVNLADLLKITKEDGTEITIDLAYLSLENVVTIVEGATDLPLDAAEAILVNFCTGKISKGTYIYEMAAAREDVITILLVVALELISDDAFAAKLNEMLGVDFVTEIKAIFEGSVITYKSPEWNYMDGIETDDGIKDYVNAIVTYPNDWTEEKAEYLAANLPALVDSVIKMVEINGVKYESLSALLKANVNIFTTETLNSLLDMIKNLLGNIDAELLKVGVIIDVDLPGLMAHKVPEGITTVEEFSLELANILNTYAKGAVEWLLLGRDFKFIVKENSKVPVDYITITGAHGYAEGLALLLEALGCNDLPKIYGVENLDTAAVVTSVLKSLAARINEILEMPVERVLDILPNLIYFLDADGIDAVITNTTAALMALIDKLSAFGVTLDINSLVDLPGLMGISDKYAEGEEKIGLYNLTLRALLRALSLMTELDFTELENVLVPFALGEAVKYDSVSASDAYKMVYKTDLDKHDMITVIVTAALRMFVENEDNAAKLDEMIGTEIVSALKDVFADVEITYEAPEWDYAIAKNGTVDTMNYAITYPNNWNEETAAYVASILPELGDMIAGMVDSKYDTLSALLKDKVNVFTTENLQAIVDLIADLLGGIDDGLLDAAGVLLGADVVGLKKYKAPADITTVDAFAAELANVLNTYAKGVVEWFLLGNDYRFLVKEVEVDGEAVAPVDFIVINGANGYSEGLALLLEALGCENLPAADGKTEDIVSGVLSSLAALINKVLNNPVETVIDLLPNILYFLNTNGVAAVVDNTLAAVTALLKKLEVFGIKVDIKALVDLKSLMGLEGTDAAISLDDLSMAAVLEAVGLMVGLDLTLIENVLVGFALGQVNKYDSVSSKVGTPKKMTYKDEFDKHDMLTVLVNLVILTLADSKNETKLNELLGSEAYGLIKNLCVNGVVPADIQEFSWAFTDKADTEEVFSALSSSEMFEGGKYGPLYTEEKANYIADNFGEFVDNIIYLLGIQVIEGKNVNSLKDLINDLLGGSLYNSANVIAIRDALAGILAGIEGLEVNGKNVGKYIANVLDKAEIADIAAVADVKVPEFSENRDMFVEYLCDVLEPLYPVLRWVLSADDIALFVNTDEDGKFVDAIKLEGGKGYQYGIIPLLEVLECKDIVDPDSYYAAVEADGNVVITSILNPLLNRVDEIINNDPAQQILDMLPNLIYFINSNGVDTVVKNTLHAVYGLLSAIAPIAEIDLYAIIGIDLAEIDFDWLFNKLLEIIKNATGYDFSTLEANAIAELTVGKLESYDSLSGETAYRMVYAEGESGDKAEMVTVVLRLLVTFLMHGNNQELVVGLLDDTFNMSDDAKTYVEGVIDAIAAVPTDTFLGMDQALAVIYYVYYGADTGIGSLTNGLKDLNAEWQKILAELRGSDDENEFNMGKFLSGFINTYFDDVLTSEGVAPNGFIAFFQRIIDWFNKIVAFFGNLFN